MTRSLCMPCVLAWACLLGVSDAVAQNVQEDESSGRGPESAAYRLRTQGYAEAVPLAAAVADFNAQFTKKGHAPLREDEVVASILCWYSASWSSHEYYDAKTMDAFGMITEKRILPKGSTIRAVGLCMECSGSGVHGREIYLQVRMDEFPTDLKGNPSFRREIRREYNLTEPAATGRPDCAEASE